MTRDLTTTQMLVDGARAGRRATSCCGAHSALARAAPRVAEHSAGAGLAFVASILRTRRKLDDTRSPQGVG
jgi:hypothetical protein